MTMDTSKSSASPDRPSINTNLKPVRRRLQIFTPKAKIFSGKRHSHDSNTRPCDSSSLTSHGMGGIRAHSLGHSPFTDELVLPLPEDLSDSKWLDYIEQSGFMLHEPAATESVPKPLMCRRPSPVAAVLPELAHLSRLRPSLDSTSSGSAPTSASTASTMRRQAKTPVFRIGQLESEAAAAAAASGTRGGGAMFGRDPLIAEKTSSVELIAEQYCAFLEHRDALEEQRDKEQERSSANDASSPIYDATSSVYTAFRSEPVAMPQPLPLHGPFEPAQDPVAHHAHRDIPVTIILDPVPNSALLAQQSPTSTNGTYVDCDESAIYFKPISFSSSPPPPLTDAADDGTYHHAVAANESEGSDSLSLQICLEFLIKELSSAFADRTSRTGDSSALAVWVMIEAYERLQNQIACMDELSDAQKRGMQSVLRSWLGTLHSVHDMISGKPTVNELVIQELSEDVD